jgi:hypothetical protein
MATTVEATPTVQLQAAQRHNRWLVAAVVVLAFLVLGLGAWVIYDQASEPATAASDEINELMADYAAAYSEGDSEAFLAVTTDDYRFKSFGDYFASRTGQAAIIQTGVQVDWVGDALAMGEGPRYFVVTTEELTFNDTVYPGVSAFLVVETDEGLKILEHTHYSDL